MSEHCRATRKDGRPCTGQARPSGFCFAHDPELQQARTEGAQKGGKHRAKAVRLRRLMPGDLAGIFDQLEAALREVHDGTLTPQQGQSLASLASACCKLLEAGEFTQRIKELEELLPTAQKRRWG